MPNAVSNQCGPVMMGSMDEEQTSVEMAKVSVAGKNYELPQRYSRAFYGVNFERDSNYSMRLENVSVLCEQDTFFNDYFGVDVYIDEIGDPSLSFSVNSEVNEPQIWYNGNINFEYNSQTKAWSMIGSLPTREWQFCKPGAVIDTMVSALECFSGFDNSKHLKTIRDILVANKAAMMAGAALYNGDCNISDPDPVVENPLGVQVPY